MSGEPERDESGLPPVDIQIPDDARELDREVQAYYRELRSARRRRRAERLVAPFTRRGMVIPLVAGTLALTLFAGTMLTVLTNTPGPSTMPQPTVRALASIPPAGQLGGLLPDAPVLVGDKPSRLRDLSSSVLAIVPRACSCLIALQQLTRQATATRISVYFVSSGGDKKQVASLATQVGKVQVVDDAKNVLATYYHPAGLTAILVHADSAVTTVETKLLPGARLQRLEAEFVQLAEPGAGYPSGSAQG